MLNPSDNSMFAIATVHIAHCFPNGTDEPGLTVWDSHLSSREGV